MDTLRSEFDSTMSHDEVDQFLAKHFGPQMKWYEDEARRLEARCAVFTWMGIVFGFLATIIAAFPTSVAQRMCSDSCPYIDDLMKWIIVVTAALASTATGILAPQYRRLASRREKGRVKTTLLAKEAEIVLRHMTMKPTVRTLKLLRFIKQLMAVEDEHGALDKGPQGHDAQAKAPDQ
jgi:hypothetical protein